MIIFLILGLKVMVAVNVMWLMIAFFLYSNHQVANLSASLRQEKEKIKVEMESSLHALNVVMKANQFISLDLVFKYTLLLFRPKYS